MSSSVAWLRTVGDGLELELLVQPRASRTRWVGQHDGRLKLMLAAPPVDGEANEALVRFVAQTLELPRGAVSLRRGEGSRRKTLFVVGARSESVTRRLQEVLG